MSNCERTSTGLIPLSDAQGDGLYPNGSNEMPADHRLAGQAALDQIRPNGAGEYFWAGFGFSNVNRKTKYAIRQWRNLQSKKKLRAFNLCRGGYDTKRMAEDKPSDPKNYWVLAEQSLAKVGKTPADIQVGWLEIALGRYTGTVTNYISDLIYYAGQVVNIMGQKYPNMKMVWVSNRTYGGYATTNTNPEPYAHATGYAVKALVEASIYPDPLLDASAPWIAWGPDLWADGLIPRSTDGLTWPCEAFADDGTHPLTLGQQIVYNKLLDPFFSGEPLCQKWYFPGLTIPR